MSDWKVVNDQFQLHLTIPPNTTATVFLPIAGQVLESGQPATPARGVKSLHTEDERGVLEVASGNYQFSGSLTR